MQSFTKAELGSNYFRDLVNNPYGVYCAAVRYVCRSLIVAT